MWLVFLILIYWKSRTGITGAVSPQYPLQQMLQKDNMADGVKSYQATEQNQLGHTLVSVQITHQGVKDIARSIKVQLQILTKKKIMVGATVGQKHAWPGLLAKHAKY